MVAGTLLSPEDKSYLAEVAGALLSPGGRTITRRDGRGLPPADKSVGATSVQAVRFCLPPVLRLLYKLLLPDTTVAFLDRKSVV